MEKFAPIYNRDGKVENPRIAHAMAKSENSMRNAGESEQYIDEVTDEVGRSEHLKVKIEITANKIKALLSPEEIEELRDFNRTSERNRFLDVITK